jgi:hypothetical protein
MDQRPPGSHELEGACAAAQKGPLIQIEVVLKP